MTRYPKAWDGDAFEFEQHGLHIGAVTLQSIPGFADELTSELSQRPSQSFGFLTTVDGLRVFIHPSLIADLAIKPGQRACCRAVIGKDKQGKPGWRALRWNKMQL
jgi:hypothetical protein